MRARLIIADDHEVVRRGLREMVAHTSDLEIVAEAASGIEAEQLARSCEADLLLLDLALPGQNGLRVLEALRADGVRLPVLVFSMVPAAQYLGHVKRAGARGFVAKGESGARLLRSIRDVLAGRPAFPAKDAAIDDPIVTGTPFAQLSRREAEVMRGLLLGHALQRIADELGVGVKSVNTYRRRLLDKLGVQSNVELAALAARHGQG
jgi:two-component system invasion response regulator UvrY